MKLLGFAIITFTLHGCFTVSLRDTICKARMTTKEYGLTNSVCEACYKLFKSSDVSERCR